MVVSFLRTVGNEKMMACSGTRSGGVYHTHLCISVIHCAPLAPQALAPCSVRSPGHFAPPAISPSWVRTTCASYLTKSVTKALAPVAISGFRGSTCDGTGDLAFLAAVSIDWETAQRTGEGLCSPLGQETEESQNINPSLILPLIF